MSLPWNVFTPRPRLLCAKHFTYHHVYIVRALGKYGDRVAYHLDESSKVLRPSGNLPMLLCSIVNAMLHVGVALASRFGVLKADIHPSLGQMRLDRRIVHS